MDEVVVDIYAVVVLGSGRHQAISALWNLGKLETVIVLFRACLGNAPDIHIPEASFRVGIAVALHKCKSFPGIWATAVLTLIGYPPVVRLVHSFEGDESIA